MARKKFAMLNVSLLNTKSFRDLKSCSDRNVYFTAHLSSQADYSGLFRYPLSLFASEAGIEDARLRVSLERLTSAELMEYEPDSELLRIGGWFRSVNCPDNLSRVQSLVQWYLSGELPQADICRRSIAEFVLGCLARAQRFKAGSQHGPKIVDELRSFLATAGVTFRNLRPFLEDEFRAHGASLAREFEDVMLGLVEAEAKVQRAADRLQMQDASRLEPGWEQGEATLPPQKNKVESNEKRKNEEGREAAHSDHDQGFRGSNGNPRPLAETLNSPIVRAIRSSA
ncbi:hypothetical protein [Thalassococcus sp. S3]|uniref:hypothetical protein n=1 Tax=Thalassococcus sp. S3 TaxID=2017482 RepID=UPI0010246822|nr:hypothetical protein [Thalassococcus sp. S3]QBF30770.1 hypothetical protein CFI11_06005 [Thalassococcus sp. S3]